jgi:hypothetical protein
MMPESDVHFLSGGENADPIRENSLCLICHLGLPQSAATPKVLRRRV